MVLLKPSAVVVFAFVSSVTLSGYFFGNSSEAHYDKGGTLSCELKKGLLFGGTSTVQVNKSNSSPSIEWGAHGSREEVYKLDNGDSVLRSSCQVAK